MYAVFDKFTEAFNREKDKDLELSDIDREIEDNIIEIGDNLVNRN